MSAKFPTAMFRQPVPARPPQRPGRGPQTIIAENQKRVLAKAAGTCHGISRGGDFVPFRCSSDKEEETSTDRLANYENSAGKSARLKITDD